MNDIIFDIEKLRKNRAFAIKNMQDHDFLFRRAANNIIESLRDIQRDFQNILIIGIRGSKYIKSYFYNKNIILFDIVDVLNKEIPEYDIEQFDCIISIGYMHGVNDVRGFLAAVKSYLKPDGLFLCSFFGGQSLNELRACIMDAELKETGGASMHIHPMIDHYQCAALMQDAGFALPVVDFDRVIVEYSNLDNLYKDLKYMGEGNALYNQHLNISNLKQLIEIIYKNRFYNEGYIATFDIIQSIGWKPHSNQQQPARRGSGQVSLTEIL
jgi:NADH dehydrogenase [ubiquinone] 1 alpha subcomplex assembly factor 5